MQIIKESIDALKTPIDSTKMEHKTVYSSNVENNDELNETVEKLSEEWTSLKNSFASVQERWLKNKDIWQQFNSRYKKFSNWLDMMEMNIVESSENGRLQPALLKKKMPVNEHTVAKMLQIRLKLSERIFCVCCEKLKRELFFPIFFSGRIPTLEVLHLAFTVK